MAAAQPGRSIRAVIAGDLPLWREALGALLATAPDVAVVALLGEDADPVRLVQAHRPDVLLLASSRPGREAARLAGQLRRASPGLAIVSLADRVEPPVVRALLQAGVQGLLPRSVSREQLLAWVRAVAAGAVVLGAELARGLSALEWVDPLTAREREVLALLAAGRRNAEIARALCITIDTVEYHVGNLLRKVGARNRIELVRKAQQHGLCSLDDRPVVEVSAGPGGGWSVAPLDARHRPAPEVRPSGLP